MSYEVRKSTMTDSEFGDYINANDSIDSEGQENDNVEIVVCAVVPDGETADMDDLLVVDASLSNAYRVEVDDTEYIMIVNTNICADAATSKATAYIETSDSDEDANVAADEDIDEQSNHKYGYTGYEGASSIERQRSRDSDNQLWTNPDVCVRECHYTRWRKHHPFKHEWEISYVCNICGDCMTELALSTHMKLHCQQFVHCRFCGSSGICENVAGCTFASGIPTLLHSTMARDMTEKYSNVQESYKETCVLLTEDQNITFKKSLESEKENVKPEVNANTETTQTKFENGYAKSKTNIATKEFEINPKIEKVTSGDANVIVNPETYESAKDLNEEMLYLTETEDDMAEEIKQLMEENTRKWGPLEEMTENESSETSVNEMHPQEVFQNASWCSENNISATSKNMLNETETFKVKTVGISKEENKQAVITSDRYVRDNGYIPTARLKRSGTPNTRYTCDICCQKFKWKNCLSRHMKLHAKIEYASCKICSKNFSRKDILYRHMNEVHFNQKLKSSKTGKGIDATCKICSKVISTKYNLIRHINDVHFNKKLKSSKTGKGFDSLVCAQNVEEAILNAKRDRARLDREIKRSRHQVLIMKRNAQWSRDKLGRFQAAKLVPFIDQKQVNVLNNKQGVASKLPKNAMNNNRKLKLKMCLSDKSIEQDRHSISGIDSRIRRRVKKQSDVVYGQNCCNFCK